MVLQHYDQLLPTFLQAAVLELYYISKVQKKKVVFAKSDGRESLILPSLGLPIYVMQQGLIIAISIFESEHIPLLIF